MSYKRTLNNDFSLFTNKEDYTGVLKNNKDEIIPFKYDDITMAGNVFIAKAKKKRTTILRFLFYKRKKTGNAIYQGSIHNRRKS